MGVFWRDRVVRRRGHAVSALTTIVLLCSACSMVPGLVAQYEYDETVDVSLDRSAIVYVNGSIAALVALHGVDLDPDPLARVDSARIRQLYAAPGVTVRRITSSRRNARRFLHITLDVDDVERLRGVAPLSGSRYRFDRVGDEYVFVRSIHGVLPRVAPGVTWTGREVAAFRLHLPSRVVFHNAPAHSLRRGNIVVWEQPLADCLAATPARFEVRVETRSILRRTLLVFALSFLGAAGTLAIVVWAAMRQGERVAAVVDGSQHA